MTDKVFNMDGSTTVVLNFLFLTVTHQRTADKTVSHTIHCYDMHTILLEYITGNNQECIRWFVENSEDLRCIEVHPISINYPSFYMAYL